MPKSKHSQKPKSRLPAAGHGGQESVVEPDDASGEIGKKVTKKNLRDSFQKWAMEDNDCAGGERKDDTSAIRFSPVVRRRCRRV